MQARPSPPTPVIALAVAALLAGCAAVDRDEANATGQQLAAAGFDIKLAGNRARREALESLPQHRLARLDRDGRSYYIYADLRWCACMYVGDRADYEAYRRLAMGQEIAEAAAMSEDTVMDWDLWQPWPQP